MVTLEWARIAAALAGGALIGLAASIWLLALGEIAGVSGVLSSTLPRSYGSRLDTRSNDRRMLSAAFLCGMIVAGLAMKLFTPAVFGPNRGTHGGALLVMAVAGLAVGIGTRVGSGCTSGHGVCGLSRGSKRSLVATMTFMIAGVLTVWLRRELGWP